MGLFWSCCSESKLAFTLSCTQSELSCKAVTEALAGATPAVLVMLSISESGIAFSLSCTQNELSCKAVAVALAGATPADLVVLSVSESGTAPCFVSCIAKSCLLPFQCHTSY